MRVGIVGCGLIGGKRAKSLAALGHTVAATADISLERAQALAKAYPGCDAVGGWRELVARADLDTVVVATINDSLASITLAAVEAGKHVLVEKPAARSAEELRPVESAAQQAGVTVRVGFNHRFHPALLKARELVDAGAVGPLMFVRGRYGHGGRVGYDREWRANPELAGGGELLDQGVHLIDLTRWFLGDVSRVSGFAGTFFWDMPVEDNGFLCTHHADGSVGWLHASCSEWKNLFCLEIYGKTGKLQVDGLGGSYGLERLAYYRMLPQMGPPETTIWEYPGEDGSWNAEFRAFEAAVAGRQGSGATLGDAVAALDVVAAVYAQSAGDGRRAA
ncbi:putative oxidoreductase YcjS [Gemmata obscuriglobus]|uniref:Gfo/Idh/MocA family oxidoreductase n=1 Tax=Gemmata obscuriglobus TaxID=114 RepID=A0A2Z3HBP1_9BACT|nr:Gfo/Idh/MocA family oxidoreductase [Gemmata obscuriglobus]AWM38630.1 gfo/Idh/MocA family oxidoreductase [Gemmata obscuriglobus]QEG28411.1 putative oxidoreductase YcjS [Gemmata obscuriglobus]VTS06359.1 oxidoreductase domain protein : Oxidoreductase domain-containing protein OS=Methyloglobulus morosus KoM1 GN=MGMO_94c00220 PE=4 SV=1: GFO_IDH_MocA: GFO_IDH_MocA_C [Gemmata obscuriglobus UQM 2246]